MKCGHCDEKIEKSAEGVKVCPLRDTNPADHTHAVCAGCLSRMTSDAPAEPTEKNFKHSAFCKFCYERIPLNEDGTLVAHGHLCDGVCPGGDCVGSGKPATEAG